MSLARLVAHRELWAAKPVLARLYEPWFELLLAACPQGARVLEVGAGPGFLGPFAAQRRPDLRFFASDLHPAPWNALAADAFRLPLADAAVGAVVGLDVLHHLARPAGFFREAARVLSSGGRIGLVEPWITPLSWLVYRFFHQEDCRLAVDPWDPFPGPDKDSFDGDAAVPWRMVRTTSPERWSELGLLPPRWRRLNAFGYLLSLGFRPASLLPRPLATPMLALDRASAPLAPVAALRAVLTWERSGAASTSEGRTAHRSGSRPRT
jgi:SAM-dependent methyltransferase